VGKSKKEQSAIRDERREALKYLVTQLKNKGLYDEEQTPKKNVMDYFQLNIRGYRHSKNNYTRLARYMTLNKNNIPYNIIQLKGYGSRNDCALKTEKKTYKMPKVGKTFYSSREWRSLRVDALVKNGRKCCLCGRSPKDGIILHVDHIKPISKFPELKLTLSNLQILCEDCNLGKSNRYDEDWRA